MFSPILRLSFLCLLVPCLAQQQYNPFNANPDHTQPPYNQNQQFGNQQYDRRNQFGNPQYGDNQSRFGDSNQDRFGDNQGRYNDNQGRNGDNQGRYGDNQGRYGDNQGRYGDNQGRYGDNQGRSGNDQGDRFGNNQGDRFGTNQGDRFGNNQGDRFGDNQGQYDSNQGQYGNNNNQGQYGSNNQGQYGGNNQFTPSQFGGGGQQLGNNNGQDNCCQEYCYTQDEQPYTNFATKTPYQVIFGKQSNQHNVPECTPIQFWSINRHGTRYPSVERIRRLRQLIKIKDDIVRNYEERRSYPDKGRLCRGDYDLLRNWRWNDSISEQNAYGLTEQGILDLKYLARRFYSRFEQLFREPYSERAYSFQYTDTDRTHDSYQAYIEGLFKQNAFQVHANVYTDDKLIQPSSSCRAWQRDVNDNPYTFDEYAKFKRTQQYQELTRDVFRRLGFRFTLNDSFIEDMYDLCRYEKAYDLNNRSPWCVPFNKDQLKLLEYAEDLKYFYKAGYGNPMSAKVGCPPVKDLYDKFSRTINGNADGNKVTVYFTHSVTILTFLTALGVGKDNVPLTADNYYQHSRRQWRTSTMDPFAANLVAVLYECRSGEKHKVMFFLNEVPVPFPECSVGLCNWSTVKQKLESVADVCSLDFCDQSSSNTITYSFLTLITLLLATFV